MCCIWALNPVHAKTKTPIFYSEIVAKSARFYYWMMNAHLQHRRRHHCCPDDGSKLCYWNWNQWRYKEDEKETMKNAQKSHSGNLTLFIALPHFRRKLRMRRKQKTRKSIVIHIHLFITYWNFPIGIRSSSTAISSLVCSMIFIYFSIDVCMKFFPMKCRVESAYSFLWITGNKCKKPIRMSCRSANDFKTFGWVGLA